MIQGFATILLGIIFHTEPRLVPNGLCYEIMQMLPVPHEHPSWEVGPAEKVALDRGWDCLGTCHPLFPVVLDYRWCQFPQVTLLIPFSPVVRTNPSPKYQEVKE